MDQRERPAGIPAGKSPLEVMLLAMEAHLAAGELDEAAGWAKDAAPYVHPKLSTVEPGGRGDATAMPGEGVSNRELAMAILALLRSSAADESEAVGAPDPVTGLANGP